MLTTWPIMVLLLVMILMFCPIKGVSSQASASVFVEPSTVSACLGESFNVIVRLADVQNLYGLEVFLNWDPAVLRAVNVDIRLGVETFSDGVLHESSSSPPIFIAEDNLTSGEYRLAATAMSPAPSFSGSGNIVRITFEPVVLGSSAVDLESQLFDYPPLDRDPRISFPIDHSTHDSFVTVETSTPEPSTKPTPVPTPTTSASPTEAPTPTPKTQEDQFLSMENCYVILITVSIGIGLALIAYLKWRK